MMSALLFHCFRICDLYLFFLDLNFSLFRKKNLIDFCSPLKMTLTLKFETWNLKLEIWNLKFEIWNLEFETWNLESEIWNLKLEIWNLAMYVICGVVEWILAWILGALKLWKICCTGLVEQIHDECGKFVGMCKSYFMSMAKFCGYRYGKILWCHEILAIENFCWAWDFLWLSWWWV